MPNWTKEQESAINESGKNIIVSAGAGSGKTAVLTERVIRKLINGTSIKNLLILTFTNNAAHEMKERIRKSIKEACVSNPKLKSELDYIDNAYITTFDAYSLSLVKKYHYIFGIGNDISIIDSSIIDLKKEEFIDEIFENNYKNSNKEFINLVDLLCVKDDKNLKTLILNILNKIDLICDKEDYFNNYIDNYYSSDFINSIFNDYENILIKNINTIKDLLDKLSSEVDNKYYIKYSELLTPLFNSNNYNDIKNNSIIDLGQLRNSTELGKTLKSEINDIIKDINNMCYCSKDVLINNLYSTKDYVISIIDIIKELYSKLSMFKRSVNKYEFNDISIMAIDLVKNNPNIREEIKNEFEEICVDEYQDTNDLQETFINLISDNNVYMVGDIKQSIYRFRNANPIIFKNKYDTYTNGNDGIKIDLVKNFRSRNEVLDDINNIFNLIMDNYIGGAEYRESHNMIFGNKSYIEEGKTNQNYNLEIYNYLYDKKSIYNKEEIEAFIIANDIKNKINNKYQVFDKDSKKLRNANYSDFVILMDRSNDFSLYKKIFEHLSIPTTLYMDENIVNENEFYIIKNIINLIINIKNNNYDIDFKYSFISIARSYLSDLNDNDIFNMFKDNSFKNSEIYNNCLDIANKIDTINNTTLLDLIVNKFDFFNKFNTITNIDNKIIIIDYLYKIFRELDSIGYGIYKIQEYLELITNNNKDIKINMNNTSGNTVKIMTIHKSKGLEYNICYYSGFDKKFNMDELKDRIIFNNKYGIITPVDNEGLDDIITKYIVKNNYIKEDISERIRLLYVSLTRAREKMIIVGDFNTEDIYSLETNGVIENRIRNKYRSFKDIVLSFRNRLDKYFNNINLDNINLTKDYKNIKSYNIKDNIDNSDIKININENVVESHLISDKHFSKESMGIINESIKSNLEYGTYLHELFECIDFKNPDLSDLDDKEKTLINNFLNQDTNKDINNAKIYKEYEFIYLDDTEKLHGIIDLMVEYNDYINIIDYKLYNTTSPEYIKQLNGYKKYINNTFNKDVNIYLYSILNNDITKL